jgi:hypothetical protein
MTYKKAAIGEGLLLVYANVTSSRLRQMPSSVLLATSLYS